MTGANGSLAPIAVVVRRGERVESEHRVAYAVAAADGRLLEAAGDVARPVFPRSAVKPLQALALVESGAADRFSVSERELALACASHGGEPEHVDLVRAWLARLGLDGAALECGAHPPTHAPSAARLIAAGHPPERVHNNCSGKHAGMITVARHLGAPVAGYSRADHPVQRLIADEPARDDRLGRPAGARDRRLRHADPSDSARPARRRDGPVRPPGRPAGSPGRRLCPAARRDDRPPPSGRGHRSAVQRDHGGGPRRAGQDRRRGRLRGVPARSGASALP